MHRLLTTILVISLVAIVVAQSAQEELFVPSNDVSLVIKCEEKAYRVGDPIKVTYALTNVSGGALFVPRGTWSQTCPPYPTFEAWLENSRGKHFVGGYAGDCSPKKMTLAERMAGEAVLLKPLESIHGYYLLETKVFKDLKPGDYRVEATIVGWNDKDFGDAQRAELRKLGHPFLWGRTVASTTTKLMR